MPNDIEPIVSKSLSSAWTRGFLKLLERPGGHSTRFIITLREFKGGVPLEDPIVREMIDRKLRTKRLATCDTVANTIFPWSMWNQNEPANLLYERYNHAWPRIKRAKGNWRGVYFQRLINYNDSAPLVNQLQYIISLWHDQIHRHSALQAGVFDPNRDHKKTRQLGFPCLHQVAFSPLGTNGVGGLSVTGFYATQTMLEKAYGNYLGLTRLGQFMAKEMGLTLVEVTCIAALENVSGKFSKGELKDLAEQLQAQTGATTEPEGDPK